MGLALGGLLVFVGGGQVLEGAFGNPAMMMMQ